MIVIFININVKIDSFSINNWRNKLISQINSKVYIYSISGILSPESFYVAFSSLKGPDNFILVSYLSYFLFKTVGMSIIISLPSYYCHIKNLSYLLMSNHITSCNISRNTCHTPSHVILSHHMMSYHIISYHIMSHHIL